MSSASTTEVFNCSPEQFFQLVSDYEKYHEFLQEIDKCTVVETQGDKKLVEYRVNMIKNFKYRLWMKEAPHRIEWTFDSGDLFKLSNGSWDIEPTEDGKTKATYSVEAKFKVFVPGPVAKALVSVNLPNMMSAYHDRVKKLYG